MDIVPGVTTVTKSAVYPIIFGVVPINHIVLILVIVIVSGFLVQHQVHPQVPVVPLYGKNFKILWVPRKTPILEYLGTYLETWEPYK